MSCHVMSCVPFLVAQLNHVKSQLESWSWKTDVASAPQVAYSFTWLTRCPFPHMQLLADNSASN